MQFVKIQNYESFVHVHTFSLNWMILPFCYHRQNLCRQNVILQKNRSLQWKVNLLLVFKKINLSSIRESSEVNYCKKKMETRQRCLYNLDPWLLVQGNQDLGKWATLESYLWSLEISDICLNCTILVDKHVAQSSC